MPDKINSHLAYKIARALKRWGYIEDEYIESVAEMLLSLNMHKNCSQKMSKQR